MSGAAHALEMRASLVVELLRELLFENASEASDRAQRRAKVVGDRSSS
jgi:hypothetical protein